MTRWEEQRIKELATAVEQLDDELTQQKIDMTLYGASIKQLLEERASRHDHNWQIKVMAATIMCTQLVQVITTLYHR